MKLGKVHKDTTDVSRVVIDCSRWLDKAELVTAVSLPTVVTDYAPGAVPQGDGQVLYPPDNTPLLISAPTIAGANVTLMLNDGTPTLGYWVEFLVTGSSGRTKTLEIYTHCNPLIPSPYLVNGVYPPVNIIMLPEEPPINPNQLWNNGNMVAVTQDGIRTTPVLNELTVTDRAYIVGYAPLQSPALTGVPTTPNAAPGTYSAQIASTKFVLDAVGVASGGVPGFTLSSVAADRLLCTLLAGSMVLGITVEEITGNAVTVFLGSSPGAQDLVAPLVIPAGQIVAISPLALTQAVWTAPQNLYLSSSSWGSAAVDVVAWYAFPAGTPPPTSGGSAGVTSILGLTGDVTQAQLWAALVAGLPTTQPATPNTVWSNGEVLCVTAGTASVTMQQAPSAQAGGVNSVCGLTGDITQAQLWSALVSGLPTSLPGSSGVVWLNGQVLCVS